MKTRAPKLVFKRAGLIDEVLGLFFRELRNYPDIAEGVVRALEELSADNKLSDSQAVKDVISGSLKSS